jgi:hypothetical protein
MSGAGLGGSLEPRHKFKTYRLIQTNGMTLAKNLYFGPTVRGGCNASGWKPGRTAQTRGGRKMTCARHLIAVGLLLVAGFGLRAAALPGSASAAPPPPPGYGRLKPEDIKPEVDQWHLALFPTVKGWKIQDFMLDPGMYVLNIVYTQPDPDHPPGFPTPPHINYPSEPVASTATIGLVGDWNGSTHLYNDSRCINLDPPVKPGKSMNVAIQFTVPVLKSNIVTISVLNPLALGDCKK